ncbi:hypothetical protein [Campylobacter sp. RM12651]|uniref:hypothetical protein n=1 Tax=Campylobacter sp. RM12651 TaxID=1660079 RepID=UPI001EFB65C5|nr:hypothetical protein [Campylobacter sp. RM12651]ULO04526.1 hypothetical protein AVBRAN_a0044 [Campylobacter sp. RM12651]
MDITTIEFQKFILFEITKIPQDETPEKGNCFLEVKIAKLKTDNDKQYNDNSFNVSDMDFIPLKIAKTHFDILFADKTKWGYPLDQKTVLTYIAELYSKGFLQKTNLYINGLLKTENEISIELINTFLNTKENEEKPVRFKINKYAIDFKDLEPLEEYVNQHRNAILESIITKLEFERHYKESNIVLDNIDLELFYKTLSFKTPIESTSQFLQDKNNKERVFIIANFELYVNKEKLKNIMKSDLNQLSNDEFNSRFNSTFELFKKFNEGIFKWVITYFLQMYRFENKLDLSSLGLLCDIATQKSDNKLFQIVSELFFGGKDKISKYNNKFIFLCEAKVLIFMPYIFNKAIKEALSDFANSENSKSQKFLKDFVEQERLNLPLKLDEKKYNEDLFNDLDDIKSVIEIFSESSLKEVYNDIIEKEKIRYNKCYPHALNELPCNGNYDELLNVFCSHNIRDIIKNDLKYTLAEVEKKENDMILENIKEKYIQSNKNKLDISQEKKVSQEDETIKNEILNNIDEVAIKEASLPQSENKQIIEEEQKEFREEEPFGDFDATITKDFDYPETYEEQIGDFDATITKDFDYPETYEEQIGDFDATITKDFDYPETYEEQIPQEEKTNELKQGNTFINETNLDEDKYKDEYNKQNALENLNELENKLIEKDNIIAKLKVQLKLLETDERIKNIENEYFKLGESLKTEIKIKNDDIKELRHQLAEKNISLENIRHELESIKNKNEELKTSSNTNEESIEIHFANFLKLYINIPLNKDEYSKNIYLLSLISCASKSDDDILNNYIDFMLEKNKLDINKFVDEYSSFLKKLDIKDKRGLERALKTTKSDARAGLLSMLDFFKDCFEYDEIDIKEAKINKVSDISTKKEIEKSESTQNITKNNIGLLDKILNKFDFKSKNKKISEGKHVSMIFEVLIDKPYYNKNIISAITKEVVGVVAEVLEKNKTSFQNLAVNTPNLKEQKEESKKKDFIVLKYELLIVVYKDMLVYEKFNNIFQKELKKIRFDVRFIESVFHS